MPSPSLLREWPCRVNRKAAVPDTRFVAASREDPQSQDPLHRANVAPSALRAVCSLPSSRSPAGAVTSSPSETSAALPPIPTPRRSWFLLRRSGREPARRPTEAARTYRVSRTKGFVPLGLLVSDDWTAHFQPTVLTAPSLTVQLPRSWSPCPHRWQLATVCPEVASHLTFIRLGLRTGDGSKGNKATTLLWQIFVPPILTLKPLCEF